MQLQLAVSRSHLLESPEYVHSDDQPQETDSVTHKVDLRGDLDFLLVFNYLRTITVIGVPVPSSVWKTKAAGIICKRQEFLFLTKPNISRSEMFVWSEIYTI